MVSAGEYYPVETIESVKRALVLIALWDLPDGAEEGVGVSRGRKIVSS